MHILTIAQDYILFYLYFLLIVVIYMRKYINLKNVTNLNLNVNKK